MGIMDFFKSAGEKLFGKEPNTDAKTKIEAIRKYIQSQGLPTDSYEISFDDSQDRVKVSGKVKSQDIKEKILLCCGNVDGVASVDDDLRVEGAGPISQYYTVQKGDTLSKISQRFYGDSMKYQQIFDANRPMLSHPDKIYPGQLLRIPPPQQEKMAQQQSQPSP